MTPVRLTQPADDDLVEIFEYIAIDNMVAAEGLMGDIEDALEVLGRFPKAGPARPELFRGARTFPVGVYLILYCIKRGEVLVLRVMHGARDLPRVLKLTEE